MPTQIGVFAKFWTPGRVKTRLAATIGDENASQVARLFVETLLRRLEEIADRRVVGYSPANEEVAFKEAAGGAWQLRPQCEGDLGERMHQYFVEAFDTGADRVVLLGADSPNLPLATIEAAFNALETAQLVLAPTDDGGYCLIGARDGPPPVFDGMPWSEATLWAATTSRLEQLGWREGAEWRSLPAWYDVDTSEDLEQLRHDLRQASDDPALMRLKRQLDSLLPV